MKILIAFSGLLALASAQFETTPKIWTGPLANNVIGQLVQDTAEVAAAKQQHNKAHTDVLAVLPELPPEIRYQQHGLAIPFVPQPQVPIVQFPQHPVHVQEPTFINNPIYNPFAHQQHQPAVVPHFTQFSEEVPRSPIGETPEVHAARVAHLQAYQEARSNLPEVRDEVRGPVVPVQQYVQGVVQGISDTPEVAAAKAAHARAFEAARHLGF